MNGVCTNYKQYQSYKSLLMEHVKTLDIAIDSILNYNAI